MYKPFLEGDEITSFGVNYKGRFLLYDPALLHRSRTPDVFEENKIMIQRITGGSKPIKAAFDNSGYYNKESILNLQLLSDEFSYYYILALLNSSTINWFYKQKFTNNSKLTVNLSKEYLEQIPIKKCDSLGQSALVIMGKLLSYSYKKKIIFSVFYRILDALVFNLYFPDHMKEREIDVLEFVERDMEQALQGREFDSLSVPEKEKVIDQLHKTWSHSDNEVRNRIKLFAVRSPEILKPILES